MKELELYERRFRTVFRIAKKTAASLHIGEILEIVRDEIKNAVPAVKEACLLMLDPDALKYTRPLHCSVHQERINCQFCKRGRSLVNETITKIPKPRNESSSPPSSSLSPGENRHEIIMPIMEGENVLAVLDVTAERGSAFTADDEIMIRDLAELAESLIAGGRKHWKTQQEKLTVERILSLLKPFVPEVVSRIVERNPDKPELSKEDRDVSILFLDVAGYTRMGETLSRDQVGFLIEKYFSVFLDVISSYHGDVNETAGDGLMSIFGGPRRENAAHAAGAALEIRRRTGDINRELVGRFPPVVINMGINSGTASVGMTRFEGSHGIRMTYTASGETTNLAARLADAARNGEVFIGPQTALMLKNDFKMESLGLMTFKNISLPVEVYKLEGKK